MGHKDGWFQNTSLVIAETFRFKAGVPLIYQNEVGIGALCLNNRKLRIFSTCGKPTLAGQPPTPPEAVGVGVVEAPFLGRSAPAVRHLGKRTGMEHKSLHEEPQQEHFVRPLRSLELTQRVRVPSCRVLRNSEAKSTSS